MKADSIKQKKPKRINWAYIFRQIGPLILLLILASVAVIGKKESWFAYRFLQQYFRFAWTVIFFGAFSHFYGEMIPSSRLNYDRPPYLPWKWEDNGRFYEKKLRISLWKGGLMDTSKAFPNMVPKSLGKNLTVEKLETLLRETVRAEFVHVTIIIIGGFLLLFVMDPYWNIAGFLIYTISNLMDIAIQRYNRPRLTALLQHARRREERRQPTDLAKDPATT